MLYPLISLFLFFQTLANPISLAQEDCEICQEEFSQLHLMDAQEKVKEFSKAQIILECFDRTNCPPPPILLIVLAGYDIKKKEDLPRAEKMLVRLGKRNERDELSAIELFYFNLALGNLNIERGYFDDNIKKFKKLAEGVNSPEYCQIQLEYFKQIERSYAGKEDFKNQLVYLNKMLSVDCEQNVNTFLGIKRKVLNANMKLGRFENYEKQAIELKEEYLNKADTSLAVSALSDIVYFFTETSQNKEKALKYAQERFNLSQAYSETSLRSRNNALQDLIQASLRIKNPEISAGFSEYIEQNDSISLREKRSLQNQALLEYNSLQIDSKNKQLLLENEIIENRNRVSYFFIAFIVGFSILFVYYLYNRSSKRELRLKLEKVLARDEERNNLAKKLHDEVATDMALLSQKLRDENLRKNLLDLRGNIRGISHELSTEDFEEISFEDQIKNLMVDMMDLGVQLNSKGLKEQDWTTYSNAFKKMLYLVIKEAVVNAQTHGKAKNIDLIFDAGKKSMLLGIKDDGTGFDTEAKVQGIGIRNMKKRVKEVDGLLEILSSPGNGAEFKFTLPIER